MLGRRLIQNAKKITFASRPAMMQMGVFAQQQRAFSSFETIQASAQKLTKSLDSEIKYENENYAQLEDIETFLSESGFQFKEEENGLNMVLSKDVGDKMVEVHFEARQPLPNDMPEQDGEEEEGPSENYCDFTVFITEGNGKNGMVVEATSMDTEIAFNTVLVSDQMGKVKAMPKFERSIQEYNGPDFTNLDERIQTSLTEYLEGFGINEHLAAFVECMSLDKDQRLYMKWLTDVKEFVSK